MKRVFSHFSTKARGKRAALFRSIMQVAPSTTILDLGSEGGRAIYGVLAGTAAQAGNVYIADISELAVSEGAKRYGYNPILLKEDGLLPFPDAHFDIVYCSSVIEHVTVPKDKVWELRSGRAFKAQSLTSQTRFANEIRRVARAYFVQTPYKHFPIESHSWLPFLNWVPRPMMISTLRVSNRYWVKRTQPDFNLLGRRDVCHLFPDAEILVERFLGLPKSLIAVRRAQ